MFTKRASLLAAIACAVAALLQGAPVHAQEKKLKFAHVFPANHYLYLQGMKIMQDKVTAATNGRIQFESYHAGQLGKATVDMLTSGIADITLTSAGYEAAKLPLSSVAELPGLYDTSCEATAKLWHIVKDGGPLADAEYKAKGIKVLYLAVLPPYQLMMTNKKISTLKDLAGLKIRANGHAMDMVVKSVGGVPVRVPSPELYDALSRGTVDGATWPIYATKSTGLEKTLHHLVKGPKLGGGATLTGIRRSVWDALSPQDQAAFTAAAAEAQKHLCAYLDKQNDEAEAQLVKEYGLVVTPLPKADLDAWNQRFVPIANEWAKDLDSANRPGTAILKAFRDAPTQ